MIHTPTAGTAGTATRRGLFPRRVAGLLAGFTLASGFALSVAEEASAAPTQCSVRTYFKEAAHANEVGVRTNCPGGGSWGRTSRYVETEVIQLQPEGPGPRPGPGGVPCDFKPSGCGPWGDVAAR
jgi:anaerobic selenocysteine-containing dehydrogenase